MKSIIKKKNENIGTGYAAAMCYGQFLLFVLKLQNNSVIKIK